MQEYEELLQIIIKVYIGATLPELLQGCAESLHHMYKVDLLADVNDRQFPELMERVTAQVRDACRGKVNRYIHINCPVLLFSFNLRLLNTFPFTFRILLLPVLILMIFMQLLPVFSASIN